MWSKREQDSIGRVLLVEEVISRLRLVSLSHTLLTYHASSSIRRGRFRSRKTITVPSPGVLLTCLSHTCLAFIRYGKQ